MARGVCHETQSRSVCLLCAVANTRPAVCAYSIYAAPILAFVVQVATMPPEPRMAEQVAHDALPKAPMRSFGPGLLPFPKLCSEGGRGVRDLSLTAEARARMCSVDYR